MRKFFLSIVSFLSLQLSFAASVDTATIYSNAMHISKKCVVILPTSAKKSEAFPTVYLLHGYSGDYSNWIKKIPSIKEYADEYRIIIVCPDGDYSSWYVDSPVDASMKYETYIAKEVPAYIESHYPVIKDRNARAITGLSMGGHGALLLGFRHADFFGACGSMSGVVDISLFKKSYDLIQRIGDSVSHADDWKEYSVINVVEQYPKDSLAIIFDCGWSDPFFSSNQRLHEKLLRMKIPHDYIERPGTHNWAYWGNAVQYQLLFFRKFFDAKHAEGKL